MRFHILLLILLNPQCFYPLNHLSSPALLLHLLNTNTQRQCWWYWLDYVVSLLMLRDCISLEELWAKQASIGVFPQLIYVWIPSLLNPSVHLCSKLCSPKWTNLYFHQQLIVLVMTFSFAARLICNQNWRRGQIEISQSRLCLSFFQVLSSVSN